MPSLVPVRRRIVAVLYGIACHGLFLAGVGAMVVGLYFGLTLGRGPFHGPWAALVNVLLVGQFPLLHSYLLSASGRRWLRMLAPRELAVDLETTVFAAISSLQLLLFFVLWSPSGKVWWEPQGGALVAHSVLFAGAWLFLGKALADAGLPLQSGALGWMAVFRGEAPRFDGFPTHGLFRYLRQPIYLGFALTLWTAPVWTPDRLALAIAWSAYCFVGPRFKEARYRRYYGEAFDRYRERVPYLLPLRRQRRA
ncbi:MAG: isoprenylcysteine carboxylmethyltransferase family protein [Holophagales bacterium]|nr:MAG: isoprenylcysteine carboxylmethyltransferase family protein [Holophagales bacterium]